MSFLKKAQQTVAHTSKLPALGNKDLRALQDLITTEKNFIQANTRAAADFKRNAEAIKAWSTNEGDDLNDVIGKVSLLYDHYTASQNRLNSHLGTVRLHFKSIRTREEALADLKSRKRSLGSDIEKVERKLAKMGPENKELMKVTTQLKEMRNEMESLRIEVMNEEAAIGDFKRRTVKEALSIKSGALLEMAEKLTIIAEISKVILDEIPLQPTQPGMPRTEYLAYARTESLLQEATRCLADVAFTPSGPSVGVPRFGDMSIADSTANVSNNLGHHYGTNDNDPYAAQQHSDSGIHGDTGYSPPILSNEELARTPIYAAHSARSPWAQDAEQALSEPATNEWASADAANTSSAAAAAALAATAGTDLNTEPSRGDLQQQDGGFLMQTGHSGSGSAKPGQHTGSNRNSGDLHSAHGGPTEFSAQGPTNTTQSAEDDHSDAYDGYAASSSVQHDNGLPAPPSMLCAPMLPPLRTATPLNDSSGAGTNGGGATATYAAPLTSHGATDDSAYFQSIGSTRAMQEAIRRPTSPLTNTNRASSYGALAPSPVQSSGGVEGKKVTAAAFRRGFNRNPSSQANMTMSPSASSSGAGYDEQSASNPLPSPSGVYSSTTPESESLTQPLHIQKRNSGSHNPLMEAAAAAADTSAHLQGRRYSNDLHLSGSDHPAPPYLSDQNQQQHYASQQPSPQQPYAQPPHPQRQLSSQYAEYAAPPPPGYGYS